MKNYLHLSLIFAVLLLTAGCDKGDPFVNPGDTPDPQWTITVENDMTSSMTAIVKVSFTDSVGTLAAFMGEDCCGIAEFKKEYGLYWLYITPSSLSNGVQLRFYSPNLKRIFNAQETFLFANDTQLGSIAEPYTPKWVVAK